MEYPAVVRYCLLCLIILLPQQSLAQTSHRPGARTSATGTDPLGSMSTSPSINTQPPDAPRNPRRARFQFIRGTVVQNNGSAAPAGTYVERVCGSRAKKEAETDSNGHFSFQIGATNVLPDASDETVHGKGVLWNRASEPLSGPFGVSSASFTELMGCELCARLAGHRSSTVALGKYHTMGDIDVGTLVLHPVERVLGTTVSITSLQAPKSARKAFDRAERAFRANKIQEAVGSLETSVRLFPRYAAAWFELGQIFQQQKRGEEARHAYLKSVEADSNYVKPYVALARIAALHQKWLDVAAVTDRALELNPLDLCEAYFLNSLANYNLNRIEPAERSAQRALRLDGLHHYPQIYLLMADIRYRAKDLAGAAEELRSYLQYAPEAADAEGVLSRIQDLDREIDHIANTQPNRP